MYVELLGRDSTNEAGRSGCKDPKMPQCFVAHTVHFLYPSLHLMFEHPLPPMMLPNHARNAREQAHGNLHA